MALYPLSSMRLRSERSLVRFADTYSWWNRVAPGGAAAAISSIGFVADREGA